MDQVDAAGEPRRTAGRRRRVVLVLGATGTIGRATVRALVQDGHAVTALVRRRGSGAATAAGRAPEGLEDAAVRCSDVTDAASFDPDWLQRDGFDAIVSCLASRTGLPQDAWAVDHGAHMLALRAAETAGIRQFILLSAICVQKPRLEFQHAKLAFERALTGSTVDWSIVRPTAYFKSLSGQIERVRRGAPYLILGDGTLTSTKPISDDDLARYIVGCLDDPARSRRVLPIGGPGPAFTPREQGEMLFELLQRAPRFRRVPVALLDAIVGGLALGARFAPRLAAKAELARIGRYYATESMLVRDPATGRYDAAATPETGSETLRDHFMRLVAGTARPERGEHAVF